MAKTIKANGTEQVEAFIRQLDAPVAEIVLVIRNLVLSSGTKIEEHIKWNNPAFYFNGEIKNYDPKSYLRDMAVFNLHKGRIMLVLLHAGELKDPAGILEGSYTDGRRLITFKDVADVENKAAALQALVKQLVNNWKHMQGKSSS